jgi:hypothetical protein
MNHDERMLAALRQSAQAGERLRYLRSTASGALDWSRTIPMRHTPSAGLD